MTGTPPRYGGAPWARFQTYGSARTIAGDLTHASDVLSSVADLHAAVRGDGTSARSATRELLEQLADCHALVVMVGAEVARVAFTAGVDEDEVRAWGGEHLSDHVIKVAHHLNQTLDETPQSPSASTAAA